MEGTHWLDGGIYVVLCLFAWLIVYIMIWGGAAIEKIRRDQSVSRLESDDPYDQETDLT